MLPITEKRRLDMRNKRRETTRIAEGTSSTLPLMNSSATLLPDRSVCLGPIVCGKEFETKEKTEERTEWQGQSESGKGGEEKWQPCCCCRDHCRACRMVQASAKNLNILGLLKRREWPLCHKVGNWQTRQSCLCPKEKEEKHQSKSPDYGMGESQGEQVLHLGVREGNYIRSIGRKG